MYVVGHEAVTENRKLIQCAVLAEEIQISKLVGIGSRINRRAFARCVTWCGIPTATTRARRAMGQRRYQKTRKRPVCLNA